MSVPIKVLIAFVLCVFLTHLFFPQLIPSLASRLVSPFFKAQKEILVGSFIPSEEAQNLLLEEALRENEELKKGLGRTTTAHITLAYILKKPPFTLYDSYIIDIGKDLNVYIGNKVYAPGGILLGEISHVDAHTSRVKLYSSYGEKFDVFIGEKNIEAEATGRGGGLFEVIVPRDVHIVEGDSVRVPRISGGVFGRVEAITLDSSRSFSSVIFAQPVNIYEQNWVLVEEGNEKSETTKESVATSTSKK